jgi:tRNA threonylcarbamoyladenosine biosynthesis protein TsaB
MLLLAVDTSGPQGGIALAQVLGGRVEPIGSTSIQGGTFSAELIPQISDLLSRHQLTAQLLQGLVAVTGPGSFTGLRVGLTAVKALAEVFRIPIAGVTSLELLITASGVETKAMAVLDAGRDEVYAGVQDGKLEEMILSLSEAVALARSRAFAVLVAEASMAEKFAGAQLVTYRSTEVAARVGGSKLISGQTIDVLALDANYIRRSEAEYKQKMKR